jgi:HAD superfamily hydrolase (TIGR01509 family)
MPLPRRPAAVIFDMDGLIFDTEALYRDAMMETMAAAGLDLPLEIYLGSVGLPADGTRAYFMRHYGGRCDPDAIWARASARFRDLVDTQLCLKAGVVELLDLLDRLALPRAIATSSKRESVAHHLAAHGLTHRFHAVVAAGDYAKGKPAPDPYLAAAARLDVAPALCLALEDSHNGVRAAHAAGMTTIMVPDLLDPTAEMESLCHRIARDLNEVADLLRAAG